MNNPYLHVQLLLTGNEIMSGDTVDSNSALIARYLNEVAVCVRRKVALGDDRALLCEELATMAATADLVATLEQLGNDNDLGLTQRGSTNRFEMTQSGDGNSFSLTQDGVGLRLKLSQTGNAPPVVIQQNGYGTGGVSLPGTVTVAGGE